MFLIINLTVADLLVGALTVPLLVLEENEKSFARARFIVSAIIFTFPLASQVNLSLISLERLHATFFPYRHCLIGKWFYYRTIIGSWLITLLVSSVLAYFYSNGFQAEFLYAWASHSVLTLLIIAVSYILITVNVQRSRHSPPNVSILAERKLTVTLFIVTVIYVLTILPLSVYNCMPVHIQDRLAIESRHHIRFASLAVYFTSSIVNPLVYAVRMREFRNAIRKLVTRQS